MDLLGPVEIDVTDAESALACIDAARPDVVYHLAALSHVGTVVVEPRPQLPRQRGGDAARAAGLPRGRRSPRVVVILSSEVYGNAVPGDRPAARGRAAPPGHALRREQGRGRPRRAADAPRRPARRRAGPTVRPHRARASPTSSWCRRSRRASRAPSATASTRSRWARSTRSATSPTSATSCAPTDCSRSTGEAGRGLQRVLGRRGEHPGDRRHAPRATPTATIRLVTDPALVRAGRRAPDGRRQQPAARRAPAGRRSSPLAQTLADVLAAARVAVAAEPAPDGLARASGLLAVEPAEEHRDRARVVAQPATAVRDHPQLGAAVRLGEPHRVGRPGRRRPRCRGSRAADGARSAGRSPPRRRPPSRVPTRRCRPARARTRSTPMLRQCRAKRAASRDQSRRSTGAPSAAMPRTRWSRAPTPSASAPPTPVPAIHTPVPSPSDATSFDREAQVGVPAADREVAVRPAGPAEVEGEDPPAGLRGDAVGELGEGEARRERAPRRRREVVAQHEPGRRPRSTPAAPSAPRARCRRALRSSGPPGLLVAGHHYPGDRDGNRARGPRIQGMGGRRAGAARGRADPRRPQGRPPRGGPALLGAGEPGVAVPHRRAPAARAGEARVPALGRDDRGRGAGRSRHPDRGLGRHRRCGHRLRARGARRARRQGRVVTRRTSRPGSAGRRATRCTCSRCGSTASTSRSSVPYRDEYGGCTSWVDLDGLPRPGARSRRRPRCPTSRSRPGYKGAGEVGRRLRPARRRTLTVARRQAGW